MRFLGNVIWIICGGIVECHRMVACRCFVVHHNHRDSFRKAVFQDCRAGAGAVWKGYCEGSTSLVYDYMEECACCGRCILFLVDLYIE